MGLVNATEMLRKAKAGHYAVAQININNLEWTKSTLLECEALKSPVILGVSEGAGKYMGGYKTVVAMIIALIDDLKITVPVALHLDHGSYDGAKACLAAGFSSIMFDGSHYPIDENIEKTRELVGLAHQMGCSIEAEVGSIGGEEDGVVGAGECADPQECKQIADLGVDMLAAGIGNIHGKYPENWAGLSFETLDAVQQLTGDMPLVLHGGTGIPADMIQKAISLGVAKINVNTECQLSFAAATRAYIEAGKDLSGKGFDPRKLLAPGAQAIRDTVREKIELFGSAGKAISMIKSFFRFNLASDDPKALVEFYRDIIGMPVLGEIDQNYDGVSFGFDAEPHLCIWRADQNKKVNSGNAELVFMCDDVNKTYEELCRRGLMCEPPFETYWGGFVLECRDPDGNMVRIRT